MLISWALLFVYLRSSCTCREFVFFSQFTGLFSCSFYNTKTMLRKLCVVHNVIEPTFEERACLSYTVLRGMRCGISHKTREIVNGLF